MESSGVRNEDFFFVFFLDGAKGKLGGFFYESRGTKNMTKRHWLDF